MNSNKKSTGILKSSWKVGQFQGVEIRLHFSLLLLLPYLVFVTHARFQLLTEQAGVRPDQLALTPVVWGLLFAVFLFFSILIHEMGHTSIALKQGTKVRSITLMMLGGIADMESISERPGQEFRLSIIGPIISLGLSGLGFLLSKVTSISELRFASVWFSQVNLVLAIFNLLPAFPLDGGRALRSLLALRMGQLRATRVATKISSVFSWIFGVLGVLSFNIFLLLIAFFLYAAAQSELSIALARRLLQGLRVGDVMSKVVALNEKDSLEEATEAMLRSRRTMLPVLLAQGVSLITLRQIQMIPAALRSTVLVGSIANTPLNTLDASDALERRINDLAGAQNAALPVCQSGSVVGLLRYSDLSELLEFRSFEESLPKAA